MLNVRLIYPVYSLQRNVQNKFHLLHTTTGKIIFASCLPRYKHETGTDHSY